MKRFLCALALIAFLSPLAVAAQDLLSVLPQDAMVVIDIHVGKLLANPEVRKAADEQAAKARAAGAPGVEEFVKNVGIDPMKDLQEIVVLVPFPGPGGQAPEGGLTLLKGTFEEAKVLAVLEKSEDFKKDGKIDKFEGLTAIRIEGKATFAVFAAPDTLAIGTEPYLKKMVAIKAGKEKGIRDLPAFAEVLKRAKTDAGVWAAGLIPADLQARLAQNASGTPFVAFAGITNVLAAVEFGADLEIAVHLGADKPETAGAIATALQGIIPSMKATGGQMPPDLIKILDAIQVKAEGPVASLLLKYNLAKLQEVLGKLTESLGSSPVGVPGEGEPAEIMPDSGSPTDTQPGSVQPTPDAGEDVEEDGPEGEDEGGGGGDSGSI